MTHYTMSGRSTTNLRLPFFSFFFFAWTQHQMDEPRSGSNDQVRVVTWVGGWVDGWVHWWRWYVCSPLNRHSSMCAERDVAQR